MTQPPALNSPIIGRRGLLLAGGALGVGAAVAGVSAAPAWGAPVFQGDPFALGVASGDPWPDGVVLWTRLAPEPLALDGSGGMPARKVEVGWEVAADERFRKVVRRGNAFAVPELGHSVHVEVRGLQPDREYFYRFRVRGALSPVGRTRTAPEPWAAAGTCWTPTSTSSSPATSAATCAARSTTRRSAPTSGSCPT